MSAYAVPMQPATNFVDDVGSIYAQHHRCSPNALRWCRRCKKRHRAKNMAVQVYYDGLYFWCKDKCKEMP